MVYQEKLVAVIRHNGAILREKDGYVTLPFGSEYSILIKNLNSRRVSIKISIDGEDVLDKQSLVIEANSSTELEGFLTKTTAKNKFKFIQKTKEIQEHRGDKIDDGMIRIEYAFEKQPSKQIITEEHYYHYNHYPWFYPLNDYPFKKYTYDVPDHTIYYTNNIGDNYCSRSADIKSSGESQSSAQATFDCDVTANCFNAEINEGFAENLPQQDEGITVKGSEINQQFNQTHLGELEKPEVMILNLRGTTETGKVVSKPITVKTRMRCKTCGRVSKSSSKFCSRCGTFLE